MLRVLLGTGFLLIFLVAGLSVWLWPKFSDLDTYRPRITALLANATQRPITIGHLEVRLFPQPRLIANDVTVFYPGPARRPFATAERVALRFYFAPVLQRQFRPRIITFEEPRLFLTRQTTSWTELWDQPESVQRTRNVALRRPIIFRWNASDVIDGILTMDGQRREPAAPAAHRTGLTGSFSRR